MAATIDKQMNAQAVYWQKQKFQYEEPEKVNKLPFVTISREYGCWGYMIALKLVEIINKEFKPKPLWVAYNRNLLDKLMADTGLSSSLIETLTGSARGKLTNLIQTTFSKFPPQAAIHKKLVEIIALLAMNGNAVIVGRGGNTVTKNISNGFHVRLIDSMECKVEKIAKAKNLTKLGATKLIKEKTKEREKYMKEFYKVDITDPHHYDMIINDGTFSIENSAGLIIQGMKYKGLL